MVDQSGSDRILVHVGQFFFELCSTVNLKRIVLRLPERIGRVKTFKVSGVAVFEPTTNVVAGDSLPTVHEAAQLAGFRKPDDRVDVVGHDHEANAFCKLTVQLLVQHPEDDPFYVVVIEQASPFVARKRNEVGIEFVVDDPSFGHAVTSVRFGVIVG